MKRKIRNFSITLIVITAVILWMAILAVSYAENKPSSPPKDGGADYFPLKAGNLWVYGKSNKEADAPDITIRVTGKAKVEGVDCFVYETSIGSRINRRDYLELRSGDGIYSRKREIFTPMGTKEFFPQPPDLLLKFPLKTGSSWEWEDNSEKKLKGFNIFEITGYESIRTEAGDFDCYRLEVYQENTRGDKYKTVRWFAKEVGMVKETTIAGTPFHPMDSSPGATFILKKFKTGIKQPVK